MSVPSATSGMKRHSLLYRNINLHKYFIYNESSITPTGSEIPTKFVLASAARNTLYDKSFVVKQRTSSPVISPVVKRSLAVNTFPAWSNKVRSTLPD